MGQEEIWKSGKGFKLNIYLVILFYKKIFGVSPFTDKYAEVPINGWVIFWQASVIGARKGASAATGLGIRRGMIAKLAGALITRVAIARKPLLFGNQQAPSYPTGRKF